MKTSYSNRPAQKKAEGSKKKKEEKTKEYEEVKKTPAR